MTDTSGTRPLPPNPSLERLRKEAKQRLKAMRPACGDVTLSDAQFQLARSYGFSSWRSLKETVERRQGMVDQPRSDMAAFLTRPQASKPMDTGCGKGGRSFYSAKRPVNADASAPGSVRSPPVPIAAGRDLLRSRRAGL